MVNNTEFNRKITTPEYCYKIISCRFLVKLISSPKQGKKVHQSRLLLMQIILNQPKITLLNTSAGTVRACERRANRMKRYER